MHIELFNKFLTLIKTQIKEPLDDIKFYYELHILMEELRSNCEGNSNLMECYRLIRLLENEVSLLFRSENKEKSEAIERVSNILKVEKEVICFIINNPQLSCEKDHKEFPFKLQWTDSKTALVELMYAVSKSINHGKLPMNHLAQSFEHFFCIDLGNFYDTLQDINIRKEPAKFLHTLIENLKEILNKMNSK